MVNAVFAGSRNSPCRWRTGPKAFSQGKKRGDAWGPYPRAAMVSEFLQNAVYEAGGLRARRIVPRHLADTRCDLCFCVLVELRSARQGNIALFQRNPPALFLFCEWGRLYARFRSNLY
jgi:hypothetical protein